MDSQPQNPMESQPQNPDFRNNPELKNEITK